MLHILKQLIDKFTYRRSPIKYARNIGVKIGSDCRLVGKVLFGSEPYLISIGNHVSITTSEFITHDGAVWVFREKEPEIDFLGRIKIHNNVFIGSSCIILPNTVIEDNVIIGASSVVKGRIQANSVYAGVPAKRICSIDEYHKKNSKYFSKTKKLTASEKREYCEKMIPDLQ